MDVVPGAFRCFFFSHHPTKHDDTALSLAENDMQYVMLFKMILRFDYTSIKWGKNKIGCSRGLSCWSEADFIWCLTSFSKLNLAQT